MAAGLMFPKPGKKKKKRIKKTKQEVITQCYLCIQEGDYSIKYTEEHHVMFGSGQRATSEAEGLTVRLCNNHHRVGPAAVHNNQEVRENLCRLIQAKYEETHTREEYKEKFKKNYLG
ncbi:MAG: hypothetical protein PHX08_01125 [Lachnospiraceae bacterium]|nr:hypothetical protein [Lachnospiraceae bacterium]